MSIAVPTNTTAIAAPVYHDATTVADDAAPVNPNAVRPIPGTNSVSNNSAQWRFTPDATVPAGHIHIDVNAGAIVQAHEANEQWMQHEATTPQLQGLA
jgi:hypothetical protein